MNLEKNISRAKNDKRSPKVLKKEIFKHILLSAGKAIDLVASYVIVAVVVMVVVVVMVIVVFIVAGCGLRVAFDKLSASPCSLLRASCCCNCCCCRKDRRLETIRRELVTPHWPLHWQAGFSR